jgi:hypothetical protein
MQLPTICHKYQTQIRSKGSWNGSFLHREVAKLETNPERPFPANAYIENKGLLAREVAKKRLSGLVSRSAACAKTRPNAELKGTCFWALRKNSMRMSLRVP